MLNVLIEIIQSDFQVKRKPFIYICISLAMMIIIILQRSLISMSHGQWSPPLGKVNREK